MCANIIRMCFIWVRFIPVEVIPEIGVCEGSPLAHPYFSGFLSSLAKAQRIWEFPGRLPDLGVRGYQLKPGHFALHHDPAPEMKSPGYETTPDESG